MGWASTSRIAPAPCRRHGGCGRPNTRWIARATNPDSPYRNRKAITPTNGGSTAGRAMTEPRVFRPGNSSHSNKKASGTPIAAARSEEHTSELQSPCNLVCRLLLEKKKKKQEERRT